jgi:hypothetical protein
MASGGDGTIDIDNSQDEDIEAFIIHQSYMEAQQNALQQVQEEQLALQQALRASQTEADQQLARQLAAAQEAEVAQQHEQIHEEQWKYYDTVLQERTQERQQGSWDCPRCSLVNPPFQPTCRACQGSAPSHVLVFQPLLGSCRFGVELEMILTNGKRDGFTYQSLAQNLTPLIQPQTIQYCGYTHETMECWKIVTDASVVGDNNNGVQQHDLCFELVSPVLDGEDGISQLRHMLESIRRLGIAVNQSCGFHVHVDATHMALPNLQRICQCFIALEDAFDLLVERTWDNAVAVARTRNHHPRRAADSNQYCRSNRFVFGERSNQQIWNQIQDTRSIPHLVNLINPNMDRYRKLNLTNICRNNRPSTIEYRNHGCVDSLLEAESWVRLVLRFTQHAEIISTTTNACLLAQDTPQRTQVERLFDVVNCSGLEQYFCVERRLFSTTSITNTWVCRTCRRHFASSRSLSQHCTALGHHR